MSMLLTNRFYHLTETTPGVSRKAQAVVLAWANAIYESPDRPTSMSAAERAARGRDRPAKTLGEIHPDRLICKLGRPAMAEWLHYNADTLTRGLTDARAAGLVESWYAPGRAYPFNRLVDPDQAALALAVAVAVERCVAHLAQRELAPIDGAVPGDANVVVAALLEAVQGSYIPRLGNRTYPDWPASGYKLAGLLIDAVGTYAGEPVPPAQVPPAGRPRSVDAPTASQPARPAATTQGEPRKPRAASQQERVLALLAKRAHDAGQAVA